MLRERAIITFVLVVQAVVVVRCFDGGTWSRRNFTTDPDELTSLPSARNGPGGDGSSSAASGAERSSGDNETTAAVAAGDGTSSAANVGRSSLPGPWVADMFYQALANFTVQENVGTSACEKQTRSYVRHLKNNTYWAVKMYDSWSKIPNGLLAGTTHQMGIYEECVSVHKPVQGKYCIASVKLTAVKGKSFELTKRDQLESLDNAWNEILGFVDYGDRYRRNEVNIGICIPESCTAENLEISLQNKLDTIFPPHHVQTRVKVEPILCSTDKNSHPYDTGYYVTSILMFLVVVICVLSTFINLTVIVQNEENEKKSSVPECIYWFSIIRNGRDLIKYDRNNNLNIFNGFKTLLMILLLLGHKYLYYSRLPVTYPKRAETLYEIGPGVFLTSMNLVDPFFFMTGFLIYIMMKPQLIKRGSSWIQVPMIIVYKYIRFIPAYGVTMLLTAYFIPYLNNGPFWESNMWPEADKCRNYWWANFLAISNFIDTNNQCLVVGWYISCLLQFLVIGTVMIYICVKNPKLGKILIVVLLGVSLVIPFVLTYYTRSYGIVRVLLPFLHNPASSFEFQTLYRPFYIRGIPFYTGMLAGVVIEELKKREFKMSRSVVYIWSIIITTICFWVQDYGTLFYVRHRPYNVIEQSTYAVLSHCTWTVGLFWVTVCHFTSGYGPIEKVLNNRFTTVFGRLTYAVYLVNMPVMMTTASRQTAAVNTNEHIWVDIWILGVVRSYITGLALYLLIEAPFNTIIKQIFFGSKKFSDRNENKECTERGNPETENIQHVSSPRL